MRALKFMAGLALLFPGLFMALWLYDLVRALVGHAAAEAWPEGATGLGLGLLAAGLVLGFAPRPSRAYVLGHELTHALTALLGGARVKRLRVRRDGGSVAVSKAGVWTALSPYVVPLLTLLVLAAWMGVRLVAPSMAHAGVFFFAAGLTWGFHAGHTVWMLVRPQPDVAAHGRLFSFVLIGGLNLAVALGLVYASAPPVRPDLLPLAAARFQRVRQSCDQALVRWNRSR